MEDKLFTITAEHSKESDAPVLTGLTSTLGEVMTDKDTGAFTGVIEEDIVNQSGTILPETGAKGTMMLIGGGSVLVLLAAIFMVTRKKMSVYED
jgi:LPXTG-motif cell wall-anchored protein